MRYTLKVNALARQDLINAGGKIESNFSPSKYCMEFSCAAHRDWWRFDLEGLVQISLEVIDIISAHSPGEEYIGERKDLLSTWSADNVIVEAFCSLNGDEEN
ncbi:linoleate 13S-lipoxygenase 3-1 chloroplastic-like [Prunus yedoensis var. nudiflora]|uniref:Linoleate 13S-lipoxygenase 3-1 chloroplastic-like n=1 Tax=Prunus yedoensis var. nudiflora TaxID=2094558 RepID=A0A314UBR1_PRUYE|nr:linoleate 13S-lipoxygenase 3-1 chloroplastic-like [Prunus yedoensis var. nudiflora]